MNSDGKIYIIVTDKLPAGSSPQPNNSGEKKESKESDDSLMSHWARDKLISEVKHLATTAATYQLSNVGNFSGDYIAQTHINDTLQNLNGLVSIATSTAAGFKVGGPWGAVIGFSLSVINQTVSSALQMHSMRVETSKTNYEIAQLRRRSGLNTVLDGSRGTEN